MLLCSLALLPGCASPRTDPPAPKVIIQKEFVQVQVPGDQLDCEPEPEAPAGGTQLDVALLLPDLAKAGADCRRKLAAVKKIVKPTSPMG